MKFVVYGAGAVGGVLGGMLSLQHHDVCLVGRRALVQAIGAGGLRVKSATGEYLAHPRATETPDPGDAGPDTCILLTVKCHHVHAAVEALSAVFPRETPIVCFQNGVACEDMAAARFARVYGGVFRMTCSMLQPGHVSLRSTGRVIVGLHPKGADRFARELAGVFSKAGFDAAASRAILADKWLKLAVNTQSVFHAVVDPRDHDSNEFTNLKVDVLEETRRVLKAAKIRAVSCDGRDPGIEEMIAELKKPRARRTEPGIKVRNSVWQDLHLKRDRVEAAYVHEPLIALGREHGVPTPVNAAALEVVQRVLASGAGPDSLRLAEVLAVVSARRNGP
jgi:2-dehydropantoate 2-reductase